jgi:hypothetical protein
MNGSTGEGANVPVFTEYAAVVIDRSVHFSYSSPV